MRTREFDKFLQNLPKLSAEQRRQALGLLQHDEQRRLSYRLLEGAVDTTACK
jgi:hypothetical protein